MKLELVAAVMFDEAGELRLVPLPLRRAARLRLRVRLRCGLVITCAVDERGFATMPPLPDRTTERPS